MFACDIACLRNQPVITFVILYTKHEVWLVHVSCVHLKRSQLMFPTFNTRNLEGIDNVSAFDTIRWVYITTIHQSPQLHLVRHHFAICLHNRCYNLVGYPRHISQSDLWITTWFATLGNERFIFLYNPVPGCQLLSECPWHPSLLYEANPLSSKPCQLYQLRASLCAAY